MVICFNNFANNLNADKIKSPDNSTDLCNKRLHFSQFILSFIQIDYTVFKPLPKSCLHSMKLDSTDHGCVAVLWQNIKVSLGRFCNHIFNL